MAGHRRNVDEVLITALACGATAEQAAHKAGVCERTVYRRLDDPTFAAKLKRSRAELVNRTGGVLTAGSLEAVKTLLELQKPGAPPNVRLGAARAILELSMKVREAAEFEERLAALEGQLSGSSGPGRPFKIVK